MAVPEKRMSGTPMLAQLGAPASRLKRIPLNEQKIQEHFIQKLVAQHPDILPIEEIEAVFAPAVCIGREVPVRSGAIDVLLLSRNGYLTIVETKLWRNPEARREVVGQIIDYAKDISRWSYEDLDERVRQFSRETTAQGCGIMGALSALEPLDETDEAPLVDDVTRHMREGRFLLLIIGDGIRESVEAMASYLSRTPQLDWRLALIELRLYEMPEAEDDRILILPQVVTRTREILRAVVRVEGKPEHVEVELPPPGDKDDESASEHTTITERDFFEALVERCGSDTADVARRIISDMEDRGCKIDWKLGSFVVKLPDPTGSGQLLTLFGVWTYGALFWGWIDSQLEGIGLPREIGADYLEKAEEIADRCRARSSSTSKLPELPELKEEYEEFLQLVDETIAAIRRAADA